MKNINLEEYQVNLNVAALFLSPIPVYIRSDVT